MRGRAENLPDNLPPPPATKQEMIDARVKPLLDSLLNQCEAAYLSLLEAEPIQGQQSFRDLVFSASNGSSAEGNMKTNRVVAAALYMRDWGREHLGPNSLLATAPATKVATAILYVLGRYDQKPAQRIAKALAAASEAAATGSTNGSQSAPEPATVDEDE